MKKYYVYELINFYGTVEYVGETYRPNVRFNEHIKHKPLSSSGKGKFYSRQDIIMNLVQEFDNRKDARKFETELKIINGLPPTEKNRSIKTGKKIGKKNGIKSCSKEVVVYKLDGTFVGEYYSVRECSRLLQLNQGNLSSILSKKLKSTKGYTIKYKKNAE